MQNRITALPKQETQEKVNLDTITGNLKVKKIDCFMQYLKEVWIDGSSRNNEKLRGISKLIFISYFNLPGIISDRLFAVLDKKRTGFGDVTTFIIGLNTLFCDNFENTSKFIFNFYDFDKDGRITAEDIRTVLSYITLSNKDNGGMCSYKDRVQSQEELFDVLEKCFNNNQSSGLDYKGFKYVIENINSDIYFIILLFLYENKPFTQANIDAYESQVNSKYSLTPVMGSADVTGKGVASPTKMTSFSPYGMFTKIPKKRKQTMTEDTSKLNKVFRLKNSEIERVSRKKLTCDPETKKDNIIIVGNSDNTTKKKKNSEINERNKIDDDIKLFPAFKQNSPLKRHFNYNSKNNTHDRAGKLHINLMNLPITEEPSEQEHENCNGVFSQLEIDNKVVDEEYDVQEEGILSSDDEQNIAGNASSSKDSIVTQEGYLYKLINDTMKKLWFKLIHRDLYYYKTSNDTAHKGMHNGSGLFLQELPFTISNNNKYYGFSVIYPNKVRNYYTNNGHEYNSWIEKIKTATGYTNLTDIYEIKHKIGSGKFGLVKLGINKQSNMKVAIKIMSKKEMNSEDGEGVRTEIEILKICQHPNIIRLYEVFENIDYFYIIMEYCSGGDLFSYGEERNFKLSEKKACEFIHKMCTALFYMHSYGIAHRDLKPENIGMTTKDENSDIRILDFGLSKIIGPEEKCTEPYGTLTYAAPEILREEPYTKSVDLWSIGVITYGLLSGTLPFDDKRGEQNIAKKVIYEHPKFEKSIWDSISGEARDFVSKGLDKKPEHRMNIKEALEHEWITKYYGSDMKKARKISNEFKSSIFELYSSSSTSSTTIYSHQRKNSVNIEE